MRESRLFISYRRDDSAGYARAIAGELAHRFGPDRVFIDVDDISPGRSFADAIHQAVARASVLLVLIGPRWRGDRGGGQDRLAEPNDFVRGEVAAALSRGLRVIPVLVEGAAMPVATDLPPELQALASLQALELSHGRFDADMARLSAALHETLAGPVSGSRRRMLRRWALVGAGLLVAAAAGAWLLRAASAGRPAINGEWQAAVTYDWPNAQHIEQFSFTGQGQELHGSAGFLGLPRGVLEGRVEAGRFSFVTRTAEMGGAPLVHRYSGRLAGDELRLVMQTEGGSSARGPVEFVARRVGPASAPGP
ncbi:MAG: toll/interleukin-1 receptor domain-containing protein [Pseudomonadota bacterium]